MTAFADNRDIAKGRLKPVVTMCARPREITETEKLVAEFR